ncbi:hypothetical protein DOTSEDRAFT_93949, partial [Dothistroma septosporum NZE10]
DASNNIQLHPLVLLTISDYITRHTIRSQSGPAIGAVIGQQNGRNFTLEHAFECKLAEKASDAVLDAAWFTERLEMYKEVHKVPALDLVALFMLGPVAGPQPLHLPVLKQVRDLTGSDNTMLLLFHPEQVDDLQGSKLPISLYEPVEESDGEKVQMRFKELAFEVESGDAEMIGVNFVAVGGGNATAVPKADTAATGAASSPKDKKAKGKGKAKEGDEAEANGASTSLLSPEDDELITTLNSKVNAIKMLNERIKLLGSYLETLPASYLTDENLDAAPPADTNFTLLRSINAMLSRLPLLEAPPAVVPEADADGNILAPVSNLQKSADLEKQDVHLTSLLASLTRSIAEAQSLGSKFNVLLRDKQQK